MANVGVLEFGMDLAKVEKPEPLPAGEYSATIMDVELRTSKNEENPTQYLAVTMSIDPSQFPPDYKAPSDAPVKVTYNRLRYASDQHAMWNIAEFQRAIGINVKGNTVSPDDWIGSPARVKITHNRQGENVYLNCDSVLPA